MKGKRFLLRKTCSVVSVSSWSELTDIFLSRVFMLGLGMMNVLSLMNSNPRRNDVFTRGLDITAQKCMVGKTVPKICCHRYGWEY